ncbi:response regulator transcription factor [Pelagicoccus sp. SDUM812003]|uniref:response regulator transcription factor n=1 Tax=Pelagicoccus sp. SDUM812003 TaxID=3041267 RepID=UPI00280DC04F|nr:response regulator transcription factor [Pelagicoccus sp. SDUM812003]MDQ8202180.1 response regulator transcription factor [Pelagicoccus sp. SDUM812003]
MGANDLRDRNFSLYSSICKAKRFIVEWACGRRIEVDACGLPFRVVKFRFSSCESTKTRLRALAVPLESIYVGVALGQKRAGQMSAEGSPAWRTLCLNVALHSSMTNDNILSSKNSIVTVAVIDDDKKLLELLTEWIDEAPGFACVGSYADAESAMSRIDRIVPDVALVDINLPGLSGIEFVKRLKERLPQTQFVMLTAYEDSEYVFDALSSGATGYLLKSTDRKALLSAVCEVYAGGSPMTSSIARKVVESLNRTAPVRNPSDDLSKRETEVLRLLAQGHLYKEIAADLGISYQTVNTHVRRIYEKLHVHSRSQAVALFAPMPKQPEA